MALYNVDTGPYYTNWCNEGYGVHPTTGGIQWQCRLDKGHPGDTHWCPAEYDKTGKKKPALAKVDPTKMLTYAEAMAMTHAEAQDAAAGIGSKNWCQQAFLHEPGKFLCRLEKGHEGKHWAPAINYNMELDYVTYAKADAEMTVQMVNQKKPAENGVYAMTKKPEEPAPVGLW